MGIHVHLSICENGGKALIDGEVTGMTEKACPRRHRPQSELGQE